MKPVWISGECNTTEKLIIAHRGASSYAKENTIESFKKAMLLGADMIEFDVRRTKDNILIAFHDEMIRGHSVKELTYEAISQLARNQGFDIPTVEEVLKWSRGKIRLDVELKEEASANSRSYFRIAKSGSNVFWGGLSPTPFGVRESQRS